MNLNRRNLQKLRFRSARTTEFSMRQLRSLTWEFHPSIHLEVYLQVVSWMNRSHLPAAFNIWDSLNSIILYYRNVTEKTSLPQLMMAQSWRMKPRPGLRSSRDLRDKSCIIQIAMTWLRLRTTMSPSQLKLKVSQKSLPVVSLPSLFREQARDRQAAIIRWLWLQASSSAQLQLLLFNTRNFCQREIGLSIMTKILSTVLQRELWSITSITRWKLINRTLD